MCLGGGGGDDFYKQEYERQRAEEEARQGRIAQGKTEIDNAFAGYDDQFYLDRAQNYVDYATPQIEDQYTDAMRQLTRALARNGTSASSYGAEQIAKLKQQKADAEVDAARKGQSYANNVRASLADAKNNLISQNNALADPTLIANMAASNSLAASAVPEYSPVAQLFAGVTDALATQSQLEARNKNRYNMAELFNAGDRSRVVN